ncbi:MAG: DNA-binding protein WhiA [Clostridia bacterium]|nr:DNA-binding protein WhiA [Clostridia bacterium]
MINISHTTHLKDELARFDTKKDCCALAELAAMARAMGELVLLGGGRVALDMSSEHHGTALKIVSLCHRLFGIRPQMAVISKRQPRPMEIYRVSISQSEVLEKIGIGTFPTPLGEFIKDECCAASALRGTFLACGIISDPNKQYLLEFSLQGESNAEEVVELLARSGISCSWTERREKEIIYVKEFDSLVSITGLMEGYSTLLELENIHIIKDVRNRLNRRTNCDSANIDKTVNASALQRKDIQYIAGVMGLDSLSAPLEEVARARLEHPDATLNELADMLGVSKSAINNRLRKIRQTACELRGQKEEF